MNKKLVIFLMFQLVWVLAQNPLLLDLSAYKVTVERQGEQQLERFEQALGGKPGEILEYRLEAKSNVDREVKNLELIVPIPQQTAYLESSALPLKLDSAVVLPQFSFDGGRSYGFPPLRKKVKVLENGKEIEKETEVKPEEYTHVRWVLPALGSKQTHLLKLRVTVR